MNDDERRLLAALDHVNPQNPAASVTEFAKVLRAEGMSQAQMYRLFDRVRGRLHDGDPRFDAVVDTMDFIWGYCSPHAALFPDSLSDERLASEPDEK